MGPTVDKIAKEAGKFNTSELWGLRKFQSP
jgi:hypothetical protein